MLDLTEGVLLLFAEAQRLPPPRPRRAWWWKHTTWLREHYETERWRESEWYRSKLKSVREKARAKATARRERIGHLPCEWCGEPVEATSWLGPVPKIHPACRRRRDSLATAARIQAAARQRRASVAAVCPECGLAVEQGAMGPILREHPRCGARRRSRECQRRRRAARS
jgi:hypothetical protein